MKQMYRSITSLITALLLSLLISSCRSTVEKNHNYKKAYESLSTHPDSSLLLVNNYLISEPGDPDGFYLKGYILKSQDHLTASAKSYKKSLELYLKEGRLDRAYQVMENLANVYYVAGLYDEAIDLYLQIPSSARDNDVLLNLSLAYRESHQYDKARSLMLVLADAYWETGDRSSLNYLYNEIGILYWQIGRFADATKCHSAALSISRSDGLNKEYQSMTNLANAYLSLGDTAVALHYLITAANNKDTRIDMAPTFRRIGDIFLSNKILPGAVEYYTAAARSKTRSLDAEDKLSSIASLINIYSDLGLGDSVSSYTALLINNSLQHRNIMTDLKKSNYQKSVHIEEQMYEIKKEQAKQKRTFAVALSWALLAGVLLVACVLYHRGQIKEYYFSLLHKENRELKKTMADLMALRNSS
jgi:tetratricopeptide (TPR) repeat protein